MSRAGLRVGLALAAFAALTRWPLPSERAASARDAATLVEYLELRARPEPLALAGLGGGRPALVTAPLGPRVFALLFPAMRPDRWRGLWLEAVQGPMPRHEWEPVERGARLALVAHDEALPGAAFAEALARAGAWPSEVAPWVAGAPGVCPYGHLGALERAALARVEVAVGVWDLESDLGDADMLRRVHTRVGPGGDVDALVRALADPAQRAAAQEAWLAREPGARAALADVLATLGTELERRAWAHGGRAVVVLLAPREELGPATREVLDAVRSVFEARKVRHVFAGPELCPRDERGCVTEAALGALAEAVSTELRRPPG